MPCMSQVVGIARNRTRSMVSMALFALATATGSSCSEDETSSSNHDLIDAGRDREVDTALSDSPAPDSSGGGSQDDSGSGPDVAGPDASDGADLDTASNDATADADPDSDDDCRPDSLEAPQQPPVDTDQDGVADYLDSDSDGDGLLDSAEDADCDGVTGASETNALAADTDLDGASDLLEITLFTDALDANDNPNANGDIAILVPNAQPPKPTATNVAFSPALQALDVYVLLDRSASMASEISTIKSNLASVLSNLTCPPLGNGDPAACIPDIWAGAGTIGYSASGVEAYRNHVDVQPAPNFSGVPTTEPTGCCDEALTFGLYASITGNGASSAAGCGLSGVPARATCSGSPAQNGGFPTFGYPCFRASALPVLVLVTDEQPISTGGTTNLCPNWASVVKPQLLARSARVVGVLGSGAPAAVQSDLQTMATDTGAVDARNGNAPLVFSGADTTAASAIQNGILSLAQGVPLDLSVSLVDDASDAVDAVTAFVAHVETNQLGTALCSSGLTTIDTNADLFADAYLGVPPKTPICWQLVLKRNETMPATQTAQTFRATLNVLADGVSTVASKDVYFVVPPLVP